MRHPLVPTLLVVALLAAYGLGGTALVAGAAGADVTVEGTVTGPDGEPAGDAVVLVGEHGLLSKMSPSELRDVAADDPQDLAVVEVVENGSFSATVDRRHADAALALSDGGVSEVADVASGEALDLRLHERRPQTVYASAVALSHGERQTDLYLSLVNNGDEAVENMTMSVTSLPDGWSVASVETAGTYDAEAGRLTWSSVPPGAEVDTTLVLDVPADAAVGDYAVEFGATSDSHPVSAEDAPVEVLPEKTAGPTQTVFDDGTPRDTDDGSETDAATPTETPGMTDGTTPTATPADSPGFGAVVALAALVAGALLWGRRA